VISAKCRIIKIAGCQKSKWSSSWLQIIKFRPTCVVNVQIFIHPHSHKHTVGYTNNSGSRNRVKGLNIINMCASCKKALAVTDSQYHNSTIMYKSKDGF